jgi:hypothetical protein
MLALSQTENRNLVPRGISPTDDLRPDILRAALADLDLFDTTKHPENAQLYRSLSSEARITIARVRQELKAQLSALEP